MTREVIDERDVGIAVAACAKCQYPLPFCECGPARPTGPTSPHASYIGGSDIGALVGVNPYKTGLDVWAEKTGRYSFGGNAATELGDHLERPVLELYARRQGVKALSFPGTLKLPDEPYLGATPDAIRIAEGRDVQCKVVGVRQAHRWGDVHDGPDAIPEEVYMQVHWESFVAHRVLGIAAEVADVPALIGTDLRVYEVPVDWALTEALASVARRFWLEHVQPDLMPEVSDENPATLLACYPRALSDGLSRPDGLVLQLAYDYDQARAEKKAAKARQDAAGEKLKALCGEALGYQGEGVRVMWRNDTKGRVGWEHVAAGYRKRLEELGQDVGQLDAVQTIHTSAPGRTLDVKINREKYK